MHSSDSSLSQFKIRLCKVKTVPVLLLFPQFVFLHPEGRGPWEFAAKFNESSDLKIGQSLFAPFYDFKGIDAFIRPGNDVGFDLIVIKL